MDGLGGKSKQYLSFSLSIKIEARHLGIRTGGLSGVGGERI